MWSKLADRLFRDKKTPAYLAALLAAGILFVALSAYMKKPSGGPEASPTETPPPVTSESGYENDFARQTERRLAEILSLVDGAGSVRVMVSVSQGAELVLAEDVKVDDTETREDDGNGGTRDISSTKRTEETLFVKAKDGTESPVVIKELAPRIEGAIIVAEGGGDARVKDALTRAAQAVLGVDIHKIRVLKMK